MGLAVAVALLQAGKATAEDAAAVLTRWVTAEPLLRAAFKDEAVHPRTRDRADIIATSSGSLHALALVREVTEDGNRDEIACHAALAERARSLTVANWSPLVGDDALVAMEILNQQGGGIHMGTVAGSRLSTPASEWRAFKCTTPIAELYPIKPVLDDGSVAAATYQVGKNLLAAGRGLEAMERFRRLRRWPAPYANAVLYLVIILHDSTPDIATSLRDRGVNLAIATDPEAVAAYWQFCRRVGWNDQEEQTKLRCAELSCQPPRAVRE